MSRYRHGTISAYTTGCRCDECREAWRLYMRRYRARLKTWRQKRQSEYDRRTGFNSRTGIYERGVKQPPNPPPPPRSHPFPPPPPR